MLAFCQFDLYTFIYIYGENRGASDGRDSLAENLFVCAAGGNKDESRPNDVVSHMAMQMSQGANDAPFARSATSFGAADIIGRKPTSVAAKPQLRSFVPQAATKMSQGANDAVPRVAMQMSQGANDAVPQVAMKMSQGTNDAPFARSATSFGAADIIGRKPTSFAAKPHFVRLCRGRQCR